MSRAWLATIAIIASAAAAPPLDPGDAPTAAPAVGPITARSGVLPWTLLDRTAGICAWQHYTHVEGIDVATGDTRWSAPGWTAVVGELPDGDVVVTNAGFGGSGQLRVAVLGRADGAERFACEAPLGAQSVGVQWAPFRGGLMGFTWPQQAPSGAARTERPSVPPLQLTLAANACELIATEPTSQVLQALRDPTGPLPWGDLTVRLDLTSAPDGQGRAALVGERGPAELWRRTLVNPAFMPCPLP